MTLSLLKEVERRCSGETAKMAKRDESDRDDDFSPRR
jgi:hypothetical protein